VDLKEQFDMKLSYFPHHPESMSNCITSFVIPGVHTSMLLGKGGNE
jgi:hypothetical protein